MPTLVPADLYYFVQIEVVPRVEPKEKLISSARSEIVVLNRKGLERRAGESYGVPEAELRRLLG